jgi:SagB-type dehydrogenase family enzyme
MGSINHIGDRFQQHTKYYRNNMPLHFLNWHNKPESYKDHYKRLKIIQLPEPNFNECDLWGVIYRRRSKRDYIANKPISLQSLSILLWATQGITADFEDISYRTTPSAGALYPIETYLNVRFIEGLEPGIYHFRPHLFDLEYLRNGDHSDKLSKAALNQDIIKSAQVTFIWTAVIARSKWKYLQRAYRYIYLDSGHIGQNLSLSAEALELGSCGIGAFFDEEVNKIINVDGTNETVLYMAAVGWPV